MEILLLILQVLAIIIVLLLILGLFLKKEYTASRSIVINAPIRKVFDFIKLVENQDKFNKWLIQMSDSDMKKELKGTDGTVGFIYAWSGKKAGEGEKEITKIIDYELFETEIRFVRPMKTVSYASMITESISENQTKVTWTNLGSMKYPFNILLLIFEGSFAKDMDISLNNLKNILKSD